MNRRSRHAGVTLVELMIVVVILFVLSTVGMFSLSGYSNSQNAAELARSIQFALARARVDAGADGRQRQLVCSPTRCDYKIATNAGKLPGPFLDGGDHIRARNHATIWNITNTIDNTANNAGSTALSGTATFTLYPDGHATGPNGTGGGTIYVCDTTGNTNKNKYKVYVYPATGMARLVANW